MKKSQNAGATQEQILAAITSCKAEGPPGHRARQLRRRARRRRSHATERKGKYKHKKRP